MKNGLNGNYYLMNRVKLEWERERAHTTNPKPEENNDKNKIRQNWKGENLYSQDQVCSGLVQWETASMRIRAEGGNESGERNYINYC